MQVELDGESLTPAVLYQIGYGNPLPQVSLSDSTWRRIEKSRQVVLDILQKKQVVYGINTGFGKFSDVIIPDDKLALLQTNLIRSHAAGVGEPISHAQTRML
jgi:histidine ammonia-lyase